ncbi:MAG: Ig-like domain-containing protein [Candidatus Limnocylindrales bacterium]
MQNIAAKALALPVGGLARLEAHFRSRAALQFVMIAGSIAVVVAGLLVGLPLKQVAAQPLPTFAPLAPQASAYRAQGDLPLDVPFEVQFTKPMNEGTVEGALTVTPAINVNYLWDATAQVLSIAPNPHWNPYTQYTIDISTAASDQEGLGLATAIHSSFQSGAPTAGKISATRMVGDRASPSTAFQVTFTRPVKLSTVILRLGISPQVDYSISGDDPTDAASQVFTLTPKKPLQTNLTYLVSMADGGTDSAGATLQPVAPLQVLTLQAPAAKFSPQDGSVVNDTNAPISVTFTVAMDEKSTAAALSVTMNGRAISGSTAWTQNDTVLIFTPRYSYYVGSSVTVRVSTSARSAGGLPMAAAAGVTFSIARPRTRTITYTTKIPYGGGISTANAPYHASELYYLSLMNCTRTGGWVTSSGDCSTASHHTLPRQGALAYDDGISSKVSRPYAKMLADLGVLTHYLNGTTTHSRLCNWGGYCSASWGENIASPGNAGQSGMISIEIFFQNEAWDRGGHYYNIMDSYFHRVGIGVWVNHGARVVIDFYG